MGDVSGWEEEGGMCMYMLGVWGRITKERGLVLVYCCMGKRREKSVTFAGVT